MKAAQRIEQALQQIVCQPEHDETLIAEYFSPHYQQWVDGKSLDFDGFVQHMAAVKAATSSVCIEIQAIAENGNEVLTHHRVSVVKPDASEAVIDVFARFTLCEGMIVRCQELTYPLLSLINISEPTRRTPRPGFGKPTLGQAIPLWCTTRCGSSMRWDGVRPETLKV